MALVVYFDEVGNPTLEATDRDFPVFALVLFVCDSDSYINEIVPRVNRFKFRWFGHEGVVLHSRDIRKAQGDFRFLTEASTRPPFYRDINELMSTSPYQLIPVAIRKDLHRARYRYPADPYDLALLFALERLVSVLEAAQQDEVMLIAERRGEREDRELYVAFQRIIAAGSEFVDGNRFRKIRFTLRFLSKSMNIIGTQMADLAAYPIARHVLDPVKPNPAFDIVRPKFCRGLKVFP
jgi:hypothetical protein